MDVIGLGILEEFKRTHPDVRTQVDSWLQEAREAAWDTPHQVTARYPRASILSDNRVVFNLKGNAYRLLVRIAYRTGKIIVLRVGTHAEYDRWDI